MARSMPCPTRVRFEEEEGDADVRARFVSETERRKEAGCCRWRSWADAARLLGFSSVQEESGDAAGLGQKNGPDGHYNQHKEKATQARVRERLSRPNQGGMGLAARNSKEKSFSLFFLFPEFSKANPNRI